LGLVGIGTMGTNSLRCLATMYKFAEIRCTSRRPETRVAFAEKWSRALGVPVVAKDSIEDVVRGADIAVGGTTSGEAGSPQAGRHLQLAGAPRARPGRLVEARQGGHRQLGVQHAAA